MKWVSILVEGQTEETFVRDILSPHLLERGISVTAKLATTKRTRSGGHFKGGIGSYSKVETDIRLLLQDTNTSLVTTLIDYYGLEGKGFPGWPTMPNGSCYQKVAHLENELSVAIGNDRFLPYIALHEFEAMLFVSPQAIVQEFPDSSPRNLHLLQAIRDEFASPEEINHEHPPSKRLLSIIENYDKNFGSLIAVGIGLDRIRTECGHFNNWLQQLEALGTP